jgi:hypothetical protein
MNSQVKFYFHNLNHLADFHLKCGILKEMAKNKTTGSIRCECSAIVITVS